MVSSILSIEAVRHRMDHENGVKALHELSRRFGAEAVRAWLDEVDRATAEPVRTLDFSTSQLPNGAWGDDTQDDAERFSVR